MFRSTTSGKPVELPGSQPRQETALGTMKQPPAFSNPVGGSLFGNAHANGNQLLRPSLFGNSKVAPTTAAASE